MKSLPLLVKEAHGCVLPECSTHFVEDLESDFLYDVYLWDWGVTITVPLRAEWVANHQVAQGLEVQPNLYKVRPQDAVAYALTTYSIQPKPVRDYLQSRFGKMLNQAQRLGTQLLEWSVTKKKTEEGGCFWLAFWILVILFA